MKIAIMCHASAGGSGVVATELALALGEHGHEVHVIATQPPYRLITRADAPIYFHEIGQTSYPLFNEPLTGLAASNAAATVVEEYGIDLIHAHYAIPYATSAILARDMLMRENKKVKVVTTLHGTDVTLVGLDASFLRSTQYAIAASDGVTAVSKYLAQHTHDAMGANRNIDVVYNWVDSTRFKPIHSPEYRARFAKPEELIVVHTSNLRPIKRPEDALKIFANIAATRPAKFIVIGDGPERPNMQALARELGINDRVQFLGSMPMLEMILGVADLFLLPSAKESFGLAALEALSCGVPVLASNIGGLPEVITPDCGALHPLADIEAATKAAFKILENKNMRLAARARAAEVFSPEKILPQYLEVYERALSS